jgi:hypothetical protein
MRQAVSTSYLIHTKHSLDNNHIGVIGQRAIAEGVGANRNTGLTILDGVHLEEHLDVLGLVDEFQDAETCRSNDVILKRFREKCRMDTRKGG